MLDLAVQSDGVIVSNDLYRDLYGESRQFKEVINLCHIQSWFFCKEGQHCVRYTTHNTHSLAEVQQGDYNSG